tara:strand:+ start:3903 stop:4163 length:261 start_codon:yes stop_codon:yes gene_type:complete
MDNKIDIDFIVINGVRYIPDKKVIYIDQHTVKPVEKDEPELVYINNKEKQKQRNKQYYQVNKSKWSKYNENKKQKAKDLQTVIEFY